MSGYNAKRSIAFLFLKLEWKQLHEARNSGIVTKRTGSRKPGNQELVELNDQVGRYCVVTIEGASLFRGALIWRKRIVFTLWALHGCLAAVMNGTAMRVHCTALWRTARLMSRYSN